MKLSDSIARVTAFSTLLIGMCAFTIVILGLSIQSIHKEIKALEDFLIEAKDIQPNFEQSLLLYTEDTKGVIAFLLSLRPQDESQYIHFIDQVETTGQRLNLNLKLTSLEKSTNTASETLDYQIEFYGSQQNLSDFLTALEQLPYMIRVTEIDYTDPNLLLSGEEAARKNIRLIIQLYVKA